MHNFFLDSRFTSTPLVNRHIKRSSRVPVIKEIKKEIYSGQDKMSTFHPISPANYHKKFGENL